MEDMLYEAYDIKDNKGIINYFNSKVNERNKKVLNQKDRLIPLLINLTNNISNELV